MHKTILSSLALISALITIGLVFFVDLPLITSILLIIFGIINLGSINLIAFKLDVVKEEKPTDFSAKSYWSIVWFQFKKNKLAVFGLIMIMVLVFIAITAPAFAHNMPLLRQDYDLSKIDQESSSLYFYQDNDFANNHKDINIDDFNSESSQYEFWKQSAFNNLGIKSINELDSRIWSPWYESLFDRTTFSEHVDLFFNSYLVILIAFVLLLPAIIILRATWFSKALKFKRKVTIIFIILGFVLACFVLIFEKQFTRHPSEFYTDQVKAIKQVKGENLLNFYNKNADVSEFLQNNIDRTVVMPLLPFAAMQGDVNESMQEPDKKHILGTTATGRDVMTVMIFGLRVSLTIGVIAVSIYCVIGIIIGAFAGFLGGWVDIFLSRFIEVMICFPAMYLLLTLAVLVKEANIYWIMLIIGITRWTGPARLIRGEYLKQRTYDYVTAATALGFGKLRVMFRHVLPNAMTPLLVTATFGVAAAILTESSLSFLGFGPANFETWGALLKLGSAKEKIHLILPSGTAIFLTVMFFNFVGEGLRDALDPKLRK